MLYLFIVQQTRHLKHFKISKVLQSIILIIGGIYALFMVIRKLYQQGKHIEYP